MENSTSTHLEWLFLTVATVFLAFAVYPEAQLDNDKSRFAAVESLVERGTWVIDDSPFFMKPPRGKRPATPIVDRVVMDGKSYSTKPPVMTFLMAGEYWVWKHVFGLSFADESQRSFLVWMLTFTFTALPFLAIGLIAQRVLRWFIEDPLTRVVGLFVILFCNQLWGFSRTLNNHVPSAFFMFVAMVTSIGLIHGKLAPKPCLFFVVGLTAGLLPTFDLPGMFFCVPLFLYLLWGFPKQTLSWFMLGAIPPLVLHFALTYTMSGSLTPIYLRKELYSYPGSYWDHMGGFDALDESKSTYFFHLSVGRKGLFSLFPILLLSFGHLLVTIYRSNKNTATVYGGGLVMAICLCLQTLSYAGSESPGVKIAFGVFSFLPLLCLDPLIRCKEPETRSRKDLLSLECFTLCALTCLWLLFYTFKTNNYGGMCYGFRWFMFFTPSLAFFSVFAIDRMKGKWGWALLCILIAVSFYSGWQCTVDPWTGNEEWPTRFLGKWEFN